MDQLNAQTIVLHQIYPDIADQTTAFELINRYSSDNRFADRGFRAGQWFEITEDVYWHFLEVLPPSYMAHYGFVNCECVTNNLYDGFVEHRGRFFNIVTIGPGHDPFSALARRLISEVTS